MQLAPTTDTPIREQLNVVWYYIFARLLLGLAVLIWVLLSVRFDLDFEMPANLSFYTLGGVFALMGTMAFFSTQHGEKPWFVWMQFIVDALFISMLLGVGGSHHNPFVLLFPLNILAAMSLGWVADVFFVTLLDVFCYALIQYFGSSGFLDWQPVGDSLSIYVKVISEIFGLLLIGGLGMVMAQQQAVTNRSLHEQILTTRRLRRRHIDVLNELPIALFIQSQTEGRENRMLVPQNRLAQEWQRKDSFLEHIQEFVGRRFEMDDQVFQVQSVDVVEGEKLILVEDVSHLQHMEKTIAQEEQLAIVGRLSASLAHEIRNPIASLSGAVQLLAEQEDNRLHTIILREVTRINELVDLFLQSARSQHVTLRRDSIVDSVTEIVEAIQHDYRAQGIQIDMGELSSEEFLVDLSKFRQVIWNLLLNAIQASPNGQVTISGVQTEHSYVLTIQDNGKGIPSQEISAIFDPFFTTRAGGTGLGLFVVRQIMKAHHGSISVQSVVGKGTSIDLYFPLEEA